MPGLEYLAGILDSEGTVTIIKRRPRPKSREINPQYYCRLAVEMAHPKPIKLLHKLFGGFGTYHDRSYSGTRMYIWIVTGPNVINVLQKLLPFLLVKKEKAELVIKMQQLLSRPKKGQSKAVPKSIQTAREKTYLQLRKSNLKNKYGKGKYIYSAL